MRGCLAAAGEALQLSLLVVALAAPAAALSLDWRELPSEPGAPVRVLVLDAATGRLAAGSERGARLFRSDDAWESVRQEQVTDLAFGSRGLLVGSRAGLFEWSAQGLRELSLGTSAAERQVRDLDAVGDIAVVATGGGLEVRLGAVPWLRAPLPSGGVDLAQVSRHRSPVPRIAAWAAGELWLMEARTPLAPRRVTLPRLPGDEPPAALGELADGRLLVLYGDALVVERGEPDARGWRVLRPSLPPGARLRRHARAFGREWLASDAGLLMADGIAGPWQRAPGPLGSRAIVHLVGNAGTLWAATERAVLVARRAHAGPARLPVAEPPVALVQRMALRHQSLEVGEVEALRRGVARRGWLPLLSVQGGYEQSRSRGDDHDEAFVSGATRRLHDRDAGRDREFDVGIALTWDLGDLAYHPEAIDVSRETRALIALRDDVLDEVNQLYFDRLRALAALAALPPDAPERSELEARAAERTAGLDAWTGGWFSDAAPAREPAVGALRTHGPVAHRRNDP